MRCYGCKFLYHHSSVYIQRVHGVMAHFGKDYCFYNKKGKIIGQRELKRDGRPILCPIDHCATVCDECGWGRRINEDGICQSCYNKKNRNKNTRVCWEERKDED